MVDVDSCTDQEIVALTAWGEFRSGAKPGMQSVVNVIQNRINSGTRWWGADFRSVCLHPFQFSCWNANDPNRFQMLSLNPSDPDYQIALGLAEDAMNGELPDLTNGATSYYDNSISAPGWAQGLTPCYEMYPMKFFKTT